MRSSTMLSLRSFGMLIAGLALFAARAEAADVGESSLVEDTAGDINAGIVLPERHHQRLSLGGTSCTDVINYNPEVVIYLCQGMPGSCSVGSTTLICPNGAMVQAPTSSGPINATWGTVTIAAYDKTRGGQVKGSFSANFGTSIATGSFDTVQCGTITP